MEAILKLCRKVFPYCREAGVNIFIDHRLIAVYGNTDYISAIKITGIEQGSCV
jgi:hypothetical protein